MINCLNRQIIGTGGGGASASIYVTGLSQTDSVTMSTPSGGTVQGVWDEVEKYEDWENPVMTSDTTPKGRCTTKPVNNTYASDAAYLAMNGDVSNGCFWVVASGYSTQLTNWYWQYECEEVIALTNLSYVLKSPTGAGYTTPIKCKFQASYDGVQWQDISSELTINFSNTTSSLTDTISIDSVEAKYIRLLLTQTGRTSQNYYYTPWICSVEIEGFKSTTIPCFKFLADEYGMHTITASNGVKTSTEEVLVDALMDYWVQMDYYTYLYRYGSDGFNSSHRFTEWNAYTRVDSVNTLTGYAVTALSNQYSLIQSDTKISVQAGQKLCVELNTSAINKSGAESRLALSSVQDYAVANEVQVAGDLMLSIGTQVQSMIVNSSGSYYVSIPIFSATTVITKIWLE